MTAPAAMPSEEDVARVLIAYFVENTGFQTVNEDEAKTSVAAYYGGAWVDLRVYPMARAVISLFSPILARLEDAKARSLEYADTQFNRALAAEAALAAEREGCAQIAERMYAKDAFRFELGTAIAAAIRAQGDSEG